MLRHLFALGPVILLGAMFFGPANRGGQPALHYGTHSGPVSSHQGLWDNPGTIVVMICGELSAVFFLIDSLRRKYRGNVVVALVLSVTGLLSFGMTSLFYYFAWGRHPIEGAGKVYGERLCEGCLSKTTDEAAPGSLALNIILGTRYMGASERCEECGSVVRTLWFWVFVPLIPLGSYRMVTVDGRRFIGRRTAMNWTHASMVYGIALSVVFLFVIVSAVNHR